jgi:hypothetical protein
VSGRWDGGGVSGDDVRVGFGWGLGVDGLDCAVFCGDDVFHCGVLAEACLVSGVGL